MKRFWSETDVLQAEGGWQVILDGRAVKTQALNPQIVPSRALAEAMAAEWSAQGEDIDPRSFPLRDLTDFSIDRVASGEEDAVSKALAFAETDTLCYRSAPGEALARRQDTIWEPLVTALESGENIAFERVAGIVHARQPDATMAALRRRLDELDPFTLAATLTLASLAASLCVALNALEDGADPAALWNAANLEEDMQAEIWGRDAEAEAVREEKKQAFLTAFRFLELLKA